MDMYFKCQIFKGKKGNICIKVEREILRIRHNKLNSGYGSGRETNTREYEREKINTKTGQLFFKKRIMK